MKQIKPFFDFEHAVDVPKGLKNVKQKRKTYIFQKEFVVF